MSRTLRHRLTTLTALGVIALSGAAVPTVAGAAPGGGTAAPEAAAPTAVSDAGTGQPGLVDRDRRFGADDSYSPDAAQRRAVRALGRDVEVGWSATGTAHSLHARHGALTPRSGAAPDTIARGFIADQRALFGLTGREVRDLRLTMHDTQAGATFLRYQQVAQHRDVHGATALVTLDRAGRIVLAGANFVPDAATAPAARIGAPAAVEAVAAAVAPGARVTLGRRLAARSGVARFVNTVHVRDYTAARPLSADLVTVGTATGARPAWLVRAEVAANVDYLLLVDAVDGRILFRENQVTHDTQGTVFQGDDPEDAANPRAQITFPAGWGGGPTTSGNNTNTYQDAEGDNAAQADDQPQEADGHFNYTWNDPWGASATGAEGDLPLSGPDRDAVVTQLFYYTNWFHDYAYGLGFDEAARNFQDDNFGNGGTGGDALEAESDANFLGEQCQDDATPPNDIKCLNNANFNTNGADGSVPRMQMFVGDTDPGDPARRTQRANNRDTVIHEYTHGISGRIISDGNLAGGIQSSSLGEGWSDAFATSINQDPVYGEYNNGDYTDGIRGVAYDEDSLEYGDFSGDSEHDNGRIWAMNMWETRAALIAKYGAAAGKDEHERLMMLGLKATVDTPSFHDARTGYLVADYLRNPTATLGIGQNWCRIWNVFADNELGLTAGPDPDTANAGSLTVSTDTPDACDPGASIAPVPDTPEGTAIALDASASTVGGDAGDTLSYAWDLDDDGQYDDSTSLSPSVTYGDNGTYTVGLQVTNSSGYTDTASETFDVTNVAPTVTIDLSDLVGMEENESRTVAATFTDPGWLDTYSGNVDLGTTYLSDVVPVVAVATQGSAGTPDSGTAEATVTYGDNGSYTVTVEITDDDGDTGSDAAQAIVANVTPTSVIDTAGEQVYDGVSAFILEAGESLTVPAGSEDPGSDDLRFTWDWDGALSGITPDVQTSLVDPPGTDPALSPSIEPRAVDLEATHVFGAACFYDLQVEVRDDDGASATDSAAVLVTGNATVSKGHGWWLNEYRPKGDTFTPAQLQCYLDIVNYLSMVFSEETVANTRATAAQVLNAPAKAPQQVIFDQHALGAWLNFANGSIKLDSPVDTDRDGVADSTFGEVMFIAETVRLDPTSTAAEVKAQKNILERIATQSAP